VVQEKPVHLTKIAQKNKSWSKKKISSQQNEK